MSRVTLGPHEYELVPFARTDVLDEHPDREALLAALDLLEYVKSRLHGFGGRASSPIELLIQVETVRAVNTFGALLHLCAGGFGVQAEMLSRVIYESTLVVAWAIDHPEEAAERYELNQEYLFYLHLRHRTDAGTFRNAPEPTPMPPERLERARAQFGPYGEKSWTGKTNRQLGQHFRQSATGSELRQLEALESSIFRFVNWSIHASGLGFLHAVDSSADDAGVWYAPVGPSATAVTDALLVGYNCALMFVQVVGAEHPALFEEPVVRRLTHRVWLALLPPDKRHALGRNSPCPCGSDRKYKQCHGRAA